MTRSRPSYWIVSATLSAVCLTGCGGGSDNAPPSATHTHTVAAATHTATVTSTPTLVNTPASTPTTDRSGTVAGILVLHRSVAANAGDALAAAPAETLGVDQASFDRTLSSANWVVVAADKQGVTSADGRFEIAGLSPGRHALQVNKTLDGNLAAFLVPFTVGNDGAAQIIAEVSLGQVKSISNYINQDVPEREIVAANSARVVIRGGRTIVELGDGTRTLTDSNGDGRLEAPCAQQLWACSATTSCGSDRVCRCTAACPSCENCGQPNVCVPAKTDSVYQCGAAGTCSRPGDRCFCVSSCPSCDDCVASVCAPACEPIDIQSIQIAGPNQLIVGQQAYLTAAAQLSDGSTVDVTQLVDWSSSDASIATVDSWGLLSALTVGSTNITATLGTVTSPALPLIVAPRPPLRHIYLQNTSCIFPLGAPAAGDSSTGVVIAPQTPTDILPVPSCTQVVLTGGTIQFRALGEFDNAYYQDITDEVQWQGTTPSVGTVDQGVFTGVQAGSTKLSAMLDGVTSDATEVRVVLEPTIVSISIYADNAAVPVAIADPTVASPVCLDCGYTLTVLKGDTLRYHATAQYDIGAWKDVTDAVTWQSSAPTVAAIDAHGVMTAVQAGDAGITASLGDVTSDTVGVHVVNEASLQSLYISQDGGDRVVAKGDQRYFRATGFYDVAGLSRDVTMEATWHSGDDTIGGFDAPGVLTGRTAGTVKVWAELNGVSSNLLSLEVFETSELSYCDPTHINRGVWSDNFNRVVLESDCATYAQPGVATLRYTVTETQPHGGVFDPCLDLYVYQGSQRVRAIREEGCGEPFLPSDAPGASDEAVKYQLRAFWDLKDDTGAPVAPGVYRIYGRFYLYYDPVVSIDVTVLGSGGTPPKLPDLIPSGVSVGSCNLTDCVPWQAMNVCVANRGAAAAGDFLVSVPPRSPIKFAGLAAGAEQCVAVPFMSSGVVGVDVNNSVIESDEGNNKLQFNLPAPVATACDVVPPGCTPSPATPTPKPTSHGPIPPTATPTPPPLCTPVICADGTVPSCSGDCVNRCNDTCATPTPTPLQPCCPFGALCIPELPPCPTTCCPRNASCTGTVPPCVPCGGITGASCPTGYQCEDDPTDQCAPPTGADCPGICVPIPSGECKSDSDCVSIGAPCALCADGTVACPVSKCVDGGCRVIFNQCAASTPSPTPTPAEPLGACFRGQMCAMAGAFFTTSQSQCCTLSQLVANPIGLSWCPPAQLDPSTGGCFACSDPCKGVPTPTPSPTEPPFCTPPPCGSNEVYYCPGICPLGCGTTCATPTPIPSGAAILVEPSSQSISCAGSFTIRVTSTGSAPLTITNLQLDNGYSQGEYGTGFSWDISQINLPATLPVGTTLAISVKYEERGFPYSRLQLLIDSNAVNTPHLFLAYHGLPCLSPTPTPADYRSPTPTPTAAPIGIR